MERITGHYDKIILTLIMCLVILFIATFSPFAESAKAIALVDDALIAILIAGLAAIGITFVTTGAFDNTTDYVESLLEEYAIDNNTTVTELFKGCQSGSNKLGQLLINNKFVLLIDSFAQWLQAKFLLTNHSTKTVLAGGAYIGDLICYPLPITAQMPSTGSTRLIVNIVDGAAQVYCLLMYSPAGGSSYNFAYVPISDRSTYATFNVQRYGASNNLQYDNTVNYYLTQDNYTSGSITITNPNCYYTVIEGQWSQVYPGTSINIQNPVYYTAQEISEAISGSDSISFEESVIINTGDIVLPTDDTDYTNGDGAVIDLDVPWGLSYGDITDDVIPNDFSDSKEGEASIEYAAEDEITEQVEETQETTNLPAGTIPFTPMQLPQLHLVDIWHYVAQWIADTAIAAGTLMAIVVQEPSPMVNLFYATVCLAIIFGLIKGLAK